jgi:2-dehydropantoate 2-reductase
VPTNAHQVEEVLRTLVPVSGGAIFLILTSNWNGTDLVDRYLPRDRYLLGYGDGGGTIRNGVYWTNLGAEIHLGIVDGGRPEVLQQVKALFERADMQPDMPENILHWLWAHNASAIGFMAGFVRHNEIRSLCRILLVEKCFGHGELFDLCHCGVDLKKFRNSATYSGPPGCHHYDALVYTFNKSMQRYTAMPILKAACGSPPALLRYVTHG